MIMRKIRRIVAFALALSLIIGTMPTITNAAVKNQVKSVSITNLDGNTLVLKKNKTFKLKAKVSVTGKMNKKVTYVTSNKKIATVSKAGKIKALKKGIAKITVKSVADSKKKVTIKVQVGTPVTKVSLNKKKIVANVGEKVTLQAAVLPKKASVKKVKFSSSNKAVAKVSKKGVVTCIGEGTTKITVKATDGSRKKATCFVTVKNGNESSTTQTLATTTQAPATTTEVPATTTETPAEPETKLSYDGYELKWSDDFDGTSLNAADWNVETHEAGWVNNELQEYVDTDENIFVKDGNLFIKPIKTVDENGTTTYTSGRINTQNKHDYTYGLFEVRAKVPEGQGYLPAFWMMPTNENLYGQWPRCGEIDIMEVMGQNNKKLYGTIHYGNPHSESQGTYVLNEGNFTDDYHTYSCEWEPGKIKWYVDGILYHEENDWYSTTVGQGTVSYPAPFDQPFYMILNLAVGGSWVGNPNDETDFDNAAYIVDYVKAYQKDSYDEAVSKPVKEVVLREPDANGNYVNNGDFTTAESLNDGSNWEFMTALGGEAEAGIQDNSMKVKTTNAGTVDYSVQLVQAGIPFEKGATYTVSFNAKASEERTMKVSVKAPDHGYSEYMPSETIDLTTENQNYSYTFKMTGDSDANGRLEFNMGAADSTADIIISNVSIKKTKDADPNEVEEKTILADGNYVYNGGFQEGDGRLGYWEITNNINAAVEVTNTNTDRRLKVSVDTDEAEDKDVLVGQSGLAIEGGKTYALSFDAQADSARNMKIMVAGQELQVPLTENSDTYSFKVTTEEGLTNKDIVFYMGAKGITYLDNVRLVEDALIKNGSFNAGFAGYEWYVDSSADATHVVDSLNETNAADFTIKNTGDQDWKIQLKQNNVELEKGKWYKLAFKAKSSLERKIRVIMQGTEAKNWAVYSGENTVSLSTDYQTFEKTFKMTDDTDSEAFLSICLGKIDEQITTQHRVCIDDITLEEIEAPEQPEVEAGVNMLKNPDFSDSADNMANWTETIAEVAEAERSISDGSIKYNITNPGTQDWNIQLKQSNLALEKGATYRVTFDVTSTQTRQIKSGIMSTSYNWYGGSDIELVEGTPYHVDYTFTMKEDDPEADFYISLGKIEDVETPASDITISNLSLIKEE